MTILAGHALPPDPPPFGCGRSPPYLPAGDGERLALPGSLLAGVTFTPAHPPELVTSPGEKTNLTQKEPSSEVNDPFPIFYM